MSDMNILELVDAFNQAKAANETKDANIAALEKELTATKDEAGKVVVLEEKLAKLQETADERGRLAGEHAGAREAAEAAQAAAEKVAAEAVAERDAAVSENDILHAKLNELSAHVEAVEAENRRLTDELAHAAPLAAAAELLRSAFEASPAPVEEPVEPAAEPVVDEPEAVEEPVEPAAE